MPLVITNKHNNNIMCMCIERVYLFLSRKFIVGIRKQKTKLDQGEKKMAKH